MIFPCNFHDISYAKFFFLHFYYVYNFENYYWILHIQYQFIIIVYEILLNTIQNKKNRLI